MSDEMNIENAEIEVSGDKKGFLAWVKAHKKQLIMAGVGITTIIAVILGIKNKAALEALWLSLEESIKKVPAEVTPAITETPVTVPVVETVVSTRSYTAPSETFDVSQHIRTMSAGKHHSPEKAAEAALLGIELLPNQTLVDTYKKCAA